MTELLEFFDKYFKMPILKNTSIEKYAIYEMHTWNQWENRKVLAKKRNKGQTKRNLRS
jgi:hypothetical protein